jgi:hypothetical protein
MPTDPDPVRLADGGGGGRRPDGLQGHFVGSMGGPPVEWLEANRATGLPVARRPTVPLIRRGQIVQARRASHRE